MSLRGRPSTAFAAISIVALILLLASCRDSVPQKAESQFRYEVIDSLLSAEYRIEQAELTMRPPRGYEGAADTIMELLQRRFTQGRGMNGKADLVQCFLDTIHISGLLVTVLDSVGLNSDTGVFLRHYRQTIHNLFGAGNVREWDVSTDGLVRKNFLGADSLNFRYQVLCLSQSTKGVELNYFGPRMHYEALAKSLESSAGTVQISTTDAD